MNFASALKGCLAKPEAPPSLPENDLPPAGWISLQRRKRQPVQIKEGPPGLRAAFLDECAWQAEEIFNRNMFLRRVQAQIDELVKEHITLGDLSPRWALHPTDILEYYQSLQEHDQQNVEVEADEPEPTTRHRKKAYGNVANKKWMWNEETKQWQFFLA